MTKNENGETIPPEVSAARIVKLPEFWRNNPPLWFTQVECLFTNHSITDKATKYRYIVSNLAPEIIEFAMHIINDNTKSDGEKFDSVKECIIKTFSESEESKLNILLAGHPLGELKLSQYLQKL